MSTEKNMFHKKFANSSKKLAANVCFMCQKSNSKFIAVTSSSKSEGKSTVSANLGKALADMGFCVLLVDTDIYEQSIYKRIGSGRDNNLLAALNNQVLPEQIIQKTEFNNLYFLDAVSKVSSIPELISNNNFSVLMNTVRNSFDFVIFDTPPILSCADSSLICSFAEQTIIVARKNSTKIEDLKKTSEQLKIINVNLLGSVVTFSKRTSRYYYYGY